MMIQDLNTIREQEDILTGKLWHQAVDMEELSLADKKFVEECERVGYFNVNMNKFGYQKEETVEERADREGWND